MSDPRRQTTKLGRQKRDPRVDTVPPSDGGRADSRRGRPSESDIPKVEGARRGGSRSYLEAELARERAHAGGDTDELLGRLIARATQAEQRAQQLEKTVAKLNEDRTVQDARMAELEHQLAELEKAAWEPPTGGSGRRRSADGRDGSASAIATLRNLVGEMQRQLERMGGGRATLPSDPPTPRVRTSEAPRSTRSEAPSSRR